MDRTGGGDHFQVIVASAAVRRAAARRAAPARQRRARRAARRRHHPRAANPDEGDDMSELRDRIQDVIDNEPVALFMKGTPQFVMCGNSRARPRGAARARRAGHGGRHPPRPGDPAGALGALRLADDPAGLRARRARRRRRHRARSCSRRASCARSCTTRSATRGDGRRARRRRARTGRLADAPKRHRPGSESRGGGPGRRALDLTVEAPRAGRDVPPRPTPKLARPRRSARLAALAATV